MKVIFTLFAVAWFNLIQHLLFQHAPVNPLPAVLPIVADKVRFPLVMPIALEVKSMVKLVDEGKADMAK